MRSHISFGRLVAAIIAFAIVVVAGFFAMKLYHKSTYMSSLKKELIKATKTEDSETINVTVTVSDNEVYIVDIGVEDNPIVNYKILVISPDNKDFSLNYGFVKGQNVVISNTPTGNEVRKLRLMSTSSKEIKRLYIYFKYNNNVEYLSIKVGE